MGRQIKLDSINMIRKNGRDRVKTTVDENVGEMKVRSAQVVMMYTVFPDKRLPYTLMKGGRTHCSQMKNYDSTYEFVCGDSRSVPSYKQMS